MPVHPLGGQIRPEFLSRLQAAAAWPKQAAFLDWVRATKGQAYAVQWWPMLRRGEVVPYHLIQCLYDYLRHETTFPFADHENVLAVVREAAGRPRLALPNAPDCDFWTQGWVGLFRLLVGLPATCVLPQEAYASEEDIGAAAAMIVENVGRKTDPNGTRLPPARAVARGERVMQITCAEYAAWLTPFWRRDGDCLLFATVPDRGSAGGVVRGGVVCSIPLAEEAFLRLRRGEIGQYELTAGDVQRPSRYLHRHACARVRPSVYGSTRWLSAAQLHCVLYQGAAFYPPVTDFAGGLTGIAVTANPENIARIKAYGYRPTGVTHKRPAGAVVLESRAPGDWDGRPSRVERIQYAAACALYRMYQEALAPDDD